MIRVIGGDFKKNGSAKLIRRKGEVAALEVPVSFMKNKLYVPKNITDGTQGSSGRQYLSTSASSGCLVCIIRLRPEHGSRKSGPGSFRLPLKGQHIFI